MLYARTTRHRHPTPPRLVRQRYLDPASICCVVMDEAHPCDRGHPLFRISMSPYLVPNCGAMSVMSARRRKRKEDQTGSFGCFNPRTAAEFPKVFRWCILLTASVVFLFSTRSKVGEGEVVVLMSSVLVLIGDLYLQCPHPCVYTSWFAKLVSTG